MMYFIKAGHFDYCCGGVPLDPPLRIKAWISEPIMWTLWRHRGDFKAKLPSELLAIRPAQFADVLQHYPRAWLTGKAYGERFVELLNEHGLSGITDVLFFGDWFKDTIQAMSVSRSSRTSI